MSALPQGYTRVMIDPDGACGYSAQALTVFLSIMRQGRLTPEMQSFLTQFNQYYNLKMSEPAFLDWLKKLTTRYDVQQVLAPVIYTMQNSVRPRDERPDPQPHPLSITNNTAIMGDIQVINQRLGLTAGFYGKSLDGRHINLTEGNPDIVCLVDGSHYDLAIKTSAHPDSRFTGNTGRYGISSSYEAGYLYRQGITDYALKDRSNSYHLVRNIMLQHMGQRPEPLPSRSRAQATSDELAAPKLKTQLLLEYHSQEVISINTLTSQFLDRIFASGVRIDDHVSTMINQGLEAISNVSSYQERLSIIKQYERNFERLVTRASPRPASVSTPFRTAAGFESPCGAAAANHPVIPSITELPEGLEA